MEKKLPKVFAKKIDKKLNNNETVYYDKNDVRSEKKDERKNVTESLLSVNQKINQIFSSARYVYKADVVITTKNGKMNKKIIGRNRNELITMDNEVINVNDILDIEFSEN